MKIDEIRDLVHSSPFQPFTIHTASGASAHVPRPDFIALSPIGRTVLVYSGRKGSHSVIDVLLVSQIDVHDQSSSVS
jgi:hypothetical protein